jgi:hypothetical protein
MMAVGDRDAHRYNMLLMEYEKDKALFNREIKRLKSGGK